LPGIVDGSGRAGTSGTSDRTVAVAAGAVGVDEIRHDICIIAFGVRPCRSSC